MWEEGNGLKRNISVQDYWISLTCAKHSKAQQNTA
jgi:hypothetical protein